MTHISRLVAVALVAASTLAYEILLVRIFAIEHFHHFAYMAIGVAMLGFGTSGTLLALFGKPNRSMAEAGFAWSVVLTSFFLVVSPALVHLLPLDPTQLAWNSAQWFWLIAVYCVLALPFAVAALGILLALILTSDSPGKTYGASLIGSGFGALIALTVLWFLSPEHALAAPALIAAFGGFALASGGPSRLAAWLTLALAGLVCVVPFWKLEVSPYKALPQVEAYPGAERVAEYPSPIGWVVAVDAPTFRYAPGLSLAYSGSFPRQTALFVDGQIAGASIPNPSIASDSVLDWMPTALPYSVGKVTHVLLIGAGGGTEIQNALSHGAQSVVAVELHPVLSRLGGQASRHPAAAETSVSWVVGDGRSYMARTREKFDLISLAPSGGFGSTAAGIVSLNEDFLHTVEAYATYMRRLNDDGLLSITRWLSVPPRESIRVILSVVEALRRVAPEHVSDGIAVIRSWGTVTVIAKPTGIAGDELTSLQAAAHRRQFDIDWRPGLTEPISIYNHLEDRTLFRTAHFAVAHPDSLTHFLTSYPFGVAPVTDGRPYPHHFLRIQSFGSLFGADRGSLLPFAEWGLIALIATLAQSALLAVLLLAVPVTVVGIRRSEGPARTGIAYFFAIGFAYMAAEIAAIQQLSLLLGHPVYAVAVVLATFLICSGLGSVWSDRLSLRRTWTVNATLLLILIIFGVALIALVHLLQSAPFLARVLAVAVVVCPLAFLMGIPFPHGLRLLKDQTQTQVAWAWAANGFASVIGAPLAALIALERGSPELFLFAAISYGVAGVLAKPQPGE